jgi:hypothetical protein
VIVIYITDARESYARTVFQEVGLPAGARVKLRYSQTWIQPPLRDGLYTNRLIGRDVLICYMDGNRGNLANAKAVACRYAKVTKSEHISDFVSIECELRGFPSSARPGELFSAADTAGLLSPGPRSGLFVVSADISPEEQLTDTSADRWETVVRRMNECSYFRTASFLYCQSLTSLGGQSLACQNGTFRLKAGATIRARIHTYAVSTESRLHHYELRVDDSAIDTVDGPAISLTYGREIFDVRLIALPSSRQRPSLIRIEPGQGENASFFTISITIRPKRLARAIQRLAIAVSGAAAATAGILPTSVPIGVRIALIVAGSLGLGLSARSAT